MADVGGLGFELEVRSRKGDLVRLIVLALCLLAGPAFAQGSVTLTWTAPTTNTDGSALTDLGGFKVYRGAAAGNYTASVAVSNAAARAYTWAGLPVGTHYFAVTAVTTAGTESGYSNVASKAIVGGFPVTVAGPVYTLQITNNSVVLPQAGTVVAGIPCDASQQLVFGDKTYMVVPMGSGVTALPGIDLIAAWGECR